MRERFSNILLCDQSNRFYRSSLLTNPNWVPETFILTIQSQTLHRDYSNILENWARKKKTEQTSVEGANLHTNTLHFTLHTAHFTLLQAWACPACSAAPRWSRPAAPPAPAPPHPASTPPPPSATRSSSTRRTFRCNKTCFLNVSINQVGFGYESCNRKPGLYNVRVSEY